MKLHILSDLHTGHCRYGAAKVCADVLVLAGDIGDNGNFGALEVAQDYLKAGLPVVYVAGNHEFYGLRLPQETLRLWRRCRQVGIEFLANRSVVLGGVRFVGATLWTDFQLLGKADVQRAQHVARQQVADFTWIFERPGVGLLPATTVRWHNKSRRFIQRTLETPFDGPTVVVSHHGVHPKSIHARFAGNSINPAFVSDLQPLLKACKPNLWVHGHVHNSFDYRVGATRVIANPRGYARRFGTANGEVHEQRENGQFNPELVVTV